MATLRVDGGDPVVGQLGTYTWGEAGSDAPFLPGAPITVGSGETLAVSIPGPVLSTSWRARAVPVDADPADGRSLGSGTGAPAFGAPPPGSWTVEVAATFADPPGSASYFWAVTVR